MSRAFDFDPKELELPPEIAAKAKRGAGIVEKPAAPSRKLSGIKRKDAFAIVPLCWARRAAKAGRYVNVMVCVELVYRAWRVRGSGKTFVMPNSGGVDRRTKIHTLRLLERAGLIAVKWRDRKSPIVTLTVSIF
jgi:hypothetical protein